MNLELHSIITSDNVRYELNMTGKARAVTETPRGLGLPPVQYDTQRGYLQDGETEIAYYLKPRAFSLAIAHSGCSRDDYWQLRSQILDIVRPNRGEALTYIFRNTQGAQYAIVARATTPAFEDVPDSQTWDEWGFSALLDLQAFDPVLFDPRLSTVPMSLISTPSALIFPITFSIFFGGGAVIYEGTTSYVGTWYAYPTITITGPCTSALIIHQQTGYQLSYPVAIDAGESVTFDLPDKEVTSTTKGNRTGFLAPSSDLFQFRLEPAPIVSGGLNTLRVEAASTGTGFAITATYNTRFIGI
jgi:hypothetical protein